MSGSKPFVLMPRNSSNSCPVIPCNNKAKVLGSVLLLQAQGLWFCPAVTSPRSWVLSCCYKQKVFGSVLLLQTQGLGFCSAVTSKRSWVLSCYSSNKSKPRNISSKNEFEVSALQLYPD
ncbi:hypothetical protein RRG08_051029 [Elysia crispata]|uniref:Uncharacterized protein n=1 Tax=Elysia crispata TaxID=231223 RepID=A0AAE0Z5X3_9GAST|nr:hypothetical protein RRG08_051029 [Elysia crispata]